MEFKEELCKKEFYFEAGIYAPDKEILAECKKLQEIICPYEECAENFQDIKQYK